MWHGCVEAPSKADLTVPRLTQSTKEERLLFQDELEQHIPVELRRSRQDAGVGLPPPDRVLQQVRQQREKPILVDISATQDGALHKEVLTPAPEAASLVVPGARVCVRITVARQDERLPLESRLVHGPKEHSWSAGSGARCQLLELTLLSMRLGERCIVSSTEGALYADDGLGIRHDSSDAGVEFVLEFKEQEPCLRPAKRDREAALRWAEEQKDSAAKQLQQGRFQLALRKYQAICEELAELGLDRDHDHGAKGPLAKLVFAAQLNCTACLLRLERWQAADRICTEVLVQEADNVKALFRRGQARLKLGHIPLAEEDFVRAQDLEPGNQEIVRALAGCRKREDQKAERAEQLAKQRGLRQPGKWD